MNEDDLRYDRLFQFAVALLRTAGTLEDRRGAVSQLLARGVADGYSRGELVDMFCVSTPNIVEESGYSESEAEAIVAEFDGQCDRHLW